MLKSDGKMRPGRADRAQDRLVSWKQIAAYLGHNVRTVQRWETDLEMPVHRRPRKVRAMVFAYKSELDQWLIAREQGGSGEGIDAARANAPLGFSILQILRNPLFLGLILLVLSVGLFSAWYFFPTPRPQADIVSLLVLSEVGMDWSGAPSPDGRFLSFAEWQTGNLAVRNLLTGEERLLTDSGTWSEPDSYAHHSIWAPDGRRIAFEWFDRDRPQLRVLEFEEGAVGEPEIVVANQRLRYVQLQPASWSQDGTRLLVRAGLQNGSKELALVDLPSKKMTSVKSLGSQSPRQIDLDPSGRYLSYDLAVDPGSNNRDIFLLDLQKSTEIPLVTGPANDYGALFMPEGRSIVFASDRDSEIGLWQVELSAGRPRHGPRLLSRFMGLHKPLGFSADGSYFFLHQSSGFLSDVHTAQLDPADGHLTNEPHRLGNTSGGAIAPDWSSDGQLAFVSIVAGSRYGETKPHLVVQSQNGSQRRFPISAPSSLWVRWAPGGRFLLIGSPDSIDLMDTDTGELRQLVLKPIRQTIFDADWLSPGEFVYICRYESASEYRYSIIRRDLQGREREIGQERAFALAVSPDRSQLALLWPNRISLVSTDGGAVRELLWAEDGDSFFRSTDIEWTPGGDHLLFGKVEKDAPVVSLWTLSVASGKESPTGLSGPNLRHLSLARDGKNLAFSLSREFLPHQLWKMQFPGVPKTRASN